MPVMIRARDVVGGDAVIVCPHCRNEFSVGLPAIADIMIRDAEWPSLQVELDLTRTQGLIFDALSSVAGRWVPTARLNDALWRGDVSSNTLKTHVFHLRQKLHGTPYVIQNRRGIGYRLMRQEPELLPASV